MLKFEDMEKRLPKGIFKHSSVDRTNVLQSCLQLSERKLGIPDCAIEIGTYYGLSTVVLASWAKEVKTFDIVSYPEFAIVKQAFLGLQNVSQFIIKNREDIRICIVHNDIKFDFAFIDAVHDYENVKKDFEIVESCGRVLFHDANNPGIEKFLNEIGAVIIWKNGNYFGYWEKGK